MSKSAIEVITWQTYNRRYNPPKWYCRDGGGKGWAKETVGPTMTKEGYIKFWYSDYGITNMRETALNLLKGDCPEGCGEAACYDVWNKIDNNFPVVYHYVRGKNGYMDYLQVFFKINKNLKN